MILIDPPAAANETRSRELFMEHHDAICRRTDRFFAWLLAGEWIAGVLTALWISPLAWAGMDSHVHPHVWAALILGFLIVSPAIVLTLFRPGKMSTRHVVAAGQMLFSALLIHLTGGRIETHFHIFGSLAFLAFYRDWKVLITASAIVTADHLIGGLYVPLSVFGLLAPGAWRWFEHAGWVVFEDVFLVISIRQSIAEMHAIANRRAQLEETNATFEARIVARTEDLERSEIELLRLKDIAEAANRTKSDFLANMSHELRTPLNGVIGMSELLLNTSLTGRQQDYALTVRRSAETLLTILNDILDLSKIEAGKLSLESIPFNLQDVVEEVGVLMSARASEKNLELIVRYSPDAPRMVEGDPVRIRQVLCNIVGNAVKFTARGHVLLEARCHARKDGAAIITLRIEDTGIGISTEQETLLFKKFSQCDASTTRRFGGTGLGLAICKSIVELMNGSITVASTPGKGSVFTITLCLQECASKDLSRRGVSTELQDLRFLIVDDNEVNRMVLDEQLTGWRLRHSVVSSGRAALDAMAQAASALDPFDVAILDFQMPDMDGEMLAKAIKANPATNRTALVLLTSMGQHFSSERMNTAGLEAMLHKPARQSALLDTLGNVWAKHSSGRPAKRSSSSCISVRTAADASLNGLRVLLVEDNEVNREVALGMLETLGCTTDFAVDGREGVQKFRHGGFDVILMDCQMPVMDGFEATGEIRRQEHADGNASHIPIVAMTANAMKGDRENCLLNGMDEYVSKPVRLDAISDVLVKVSGRSPSISGSNVHMTSVSNQRPAVDMSGALETAGGKPDRLKRIFKAFINDIPKRLSALNTALTSGDAKTAEREAHSIKGASANISASKLRASAFEIERACKADGLTYAAELFPALAKDAEHVVRELTVHIVEESTAVVVSGY